MAPKLCELHNVWMTEKIGKNGKPYFGHKVEGQYGMCFGRPAQITPTPITVVQPPIQTNSRPVQLQEEEREPLEEPIPVNGMFLCSAFNNATEIVASGKFNIIDSTGLARLGWKIYDGMINRPKEEDDRTD